MADQERFNHIVQHNKDGSETHIPVHLFKTTVEVGDKTARVLAATGVLLGGVGVGAGAYAIYDRLTEPVPIEAPVDPNVAAQIEELREALTSNTLGDCVNENVLRRTLGGEPIPFEKCIAERQEWYGKLRDKANVTPEP